MAIDPVGLALEAPNAPAFEQALLAQLRWEIGFEAAFIVVPGEMPTTVALDPARLHTALSDGRYEEETLPLKAAASRSQGVIVDTDVLGERAVRATRYHRELAAPIGGRHSLVAYLQARGRPVGLMMLGRTGRAFAEREIERVREAAGKAALARASYGLAYVEAPLPQGRPSLPQRLSHVLNGTVVRERVQRGGQSVLVRDVGHEREMVAQRGPLELVWTRVDTREPRRSAWFYVELFQLALARAKERKRALFIGAGGGASIRQFRSLQPGIAIDVVELDHEVLRLANDWFGLDGIPGVQAMVSDGAEHIASAPEASWDVLVIDAYGAGHELPPVFMSDRFWDDARRVLRAGGSLAINVIGALDGSGTVARVAQALAQRFERVHAVPVADSAAFDPSAARNVVLLASRAA